MKTFNPGDKVAWRMPMDIYEGIVVKQTGSVVEILLIIGPNNETHPASVERDSRYLNLIGSVNGDDT